MTFSQIKTIMILKYGSMGKATSAWTDTCRKPTDAAEQEEMKQLIYWWEHATNSQKDEVINE